MTRWVWLYLSRARVLEPALLPGAAVLRVVRGGHAGVVQRRLVLGVGVRLLPLLLLQLLLDHLLLLLCLDDHGQGLQQQQEMSLKYFPHKRNTKIGGKLMFLRACERQTYPRIEPGSPIGGSRICIKQFDRKITVYKSAQFGSFCLENVTIKK